MRVGRALTRRAAVHGGACNARAIGVPEQSSGADATAIYVAHVRVPQAGKYQLVARPVGGRERIAGVAELDVARVASAGGAVDVPRRA